MIDALQEERRRLQTLLGNLPGMAYRCRDNRDWSMDIVSTGCLQLTGYSAEDLTANRRFSYADLIHPEDRQMVWDGVRQGVDHGRPFELTYRIRTASGEEKWVWERGLGVLSAQGEVEDLEGFITDITDLKRAEETLRQSEARFKAIADTSPLAIVMSTRAEERTTYVNRTFVQLFGYSLEDVPDIAR
jgi:PAS domain S-box-containing protein